MLCEQRMASLSHFFSICFSFIPFQHFFSFFFYLSTKGPGSNKVLENSYHQLAVYGDKLYHEVHQYLESDTIQAKRENIQRSQEELKRIKNLYNACTDFAEKKEVHR